MKKLTPRKLQFFKRLAVEAEKEAVNPDRGSSIVLTCKALNMNVKQGYHYTTHLKALGFLYNRGVKVTEKGKKYLVENSD